MTSSPITDEMIEAALSKAAEYGLNLRDKHGNEHMRAMLEAALATEHPLARMVRSDEEMGLYDDEKVPPSPNLAMHSSAPPVMGMEELRDETFAEVIASIRFYADDYGYDIGLVRGAMLRAADLLERVRSHLSTPLVTGRE